MGLSAFLIFKINVNMNVGLHDFLYGLDPAPVSMNLPEEILHHAPLPV